MGSLWCTSFVVFLYSFAWHNGNLTGLSIVACISFAHSLVLIVLIYLSLTM